MEIITSFIFAFIATMAFAVLFQSPKKILLTDGLIGAVGWVVFISLRDQMGYSSFYANFFGTLALALFRMENIILQTILAEHCTSISEKTLPLI